MSAGGISLYLNLTLPSHISRQLSLVLNQVSLRNPTTKAIGLMGGALVG